jgi:hypothetical protein
MADITNEYGVDPLTGDRIAIDPPLQQSETPLMGNPVLMRGNQPRKAKSNTALYAGAAVAVVAVLAGGAYLIASGAHQHSDLMTNAQATPPAAEQQAAATPAPAPLASPPLATPAAPSAPVVASAETPVSPLHAPRAERAEAKAIRHVERREAAKAAADSGADAAASVTSSQVVQPSVAAPQPAPAQAPSTPMVAPQVAPVITPPPAQ